MADERPITPPMRKPVSTFPTPSHVVSLYTELVNRDDPAYKANAPVKRGAIYSTMVGAKPEVIAQFPLLYFLRERQFQGSDQLVFWDWINDEQAHDTYNSTDSYAFESISHPGFQREYTIRRDQYNDEPAIALGLPLNTLTAVRIVDGGGNYTSATGTIEGTTVAIDFVVLDGVIISGVVTDQGEGILGTSEITVTGDGAGAIVEPIVQSTAAVLVGQKKVELDPQDPLQHEFIKLVRIYQTLPGPTIYSTRIDEDGAVVQIATTAKIAATIISRENINVNTWTKVTKQQQDNVYVGNEVVETRTVKTASSDPADNHTMTSNRIDSDGFVVQIDSTLSDVTSINEGETLSGAGTWVIITSQAVSDLVAKEIRETRSVPGNPVVSSRLDKDGVKVDTVRTLKDVTKITTQESLTLGVWTKTTIDPISLRLHSDELSDLVAWEVVEGRAIPGTAVPSARVDSDHETATIQSTLKDQSVIVPGASESGGTLTTIDKKEVTELISEEIRTSKIWLDEALYSQRLPETLIPAEFRSSIPTVTESHILAGTASMPTLTGSQIFAQQRQLTKIFYENRVESFGINLAFPIIQIGYENTELYGGGVLEITRTLNNSSMTTDTGEDVVRSVVNPIGVNLMWIKETARRFTEIVWPSLTEYDQDPETQSLITTTYQVVNASTVVAPSIVNGVITRFKHIDVWRSLKIVETYSLPASYEEQRFMAQTFPSLWDWHTYNYSTACGATGPIRHGFSTMVQARLAISFTTSKTTITGLTLIPNTHHLVHDIINAVLNDVGVLNYVGTCSGPVALPASSPDYSTYLSTIQNTEQLISGESVRWRAGLYKNSSLYVTML